MEAFTICIRESFLTLYSDVKIPQGHGSDKRIVSYRRLRRQPNGQNIQFRAAYLRDALRRQFAQSVEYGSARFNWKNGTRESRASCVRQSSQILAYYICDKSKMKYSIVP